MPALLPANKTSAPRQAHWFIVSKADMDAPDSFGSAMRLDACVDGDPKRHIGLYVTRHGGVVLAWGAWRIENDLERLGYRLRTSDQDQARWWNDPAAKQLVSAWIAYARAYARGVFAGRDGPQGA